MPNQGIWVTVDGQVDYLRCYSSGMLDRGTAAAVIYLHGDRLWGDMPVSYDDNTSRQQQEIAGAACEQTGLSFILLARSGIYGSSRCHAHPRTLHEVRVVNAALRAIRVRYQITPPAVTAQSGGAAPAAHALTQQPELCCVVLTSGALSMRTATAHDPSSTYDTRTPGLYDAVAHVAEFGANGNRRVIVTASEGDRFSLPDNRRDYADALARARCGHDVHFMWGRNDGEDRHTFDRKGWNAAAWCLDGIALDEIAGRLRAGWSRNDVES